MDSQKVVNPVKTGVQTFSKRLKRLDSGVRRNNEETPFGPFYETINLRCNIKIEHGLGHDGKEESMSEQKHLSNMLGSSG